MIGLLSPFFRLLAKKETALPRMSIFKTLVNLAILKRRNPETSPVKVKMDRFILNGPDYSLLSFLIKEKFIDEEYHFQTSVTRPVIFDCGASIGMAMIYFKSLYPNATIQCFEPNPGAMHLLKLNVDENNLKDVTLHESALTAKERSVLLTIPDQKSMLNAGVHFNADGSTSIIVQAEQLSNYITAAGKVDLVKIDVEGSEYEIVKELQHSGVLAGRAVKQFIIEFHTLLLKDKISLDDFCSIFENNGYGVSQQKLFYHNPDSDYIIHAIAMERSKR
ncbi:FkbM family methyltransferase [Pollutibacter soli]|uniref:FkbM family methyltransferase n=1 Tax=Pollutibacter soli TaxID=3034157 RepID=UPI0030141C99